VASTSQLARRADYTELLTSVKEQLWLDSPVVARRLTVDSEQLQFSFAEREWTDLDRFLSTQDFLHDKLMSNNPKLKFEGVHGLWELAVDGDHRQHFSMEVRPPLRPTPPPTRRLSHLPRPHSPTNSP
jgi:hypothetical protein